MCSREQALIILDEVSKACGRLFNIQDAYLYGSYARGDYHSESDVDILLAADAGPDEIRRQRKAVASIVSDLCLKHDVTISVTVKPAEQFARYAGILPYYRNVVREGVRHGT